MSTPVHNNASDADNTGNADDVEAYNQVIGKAEGFQLC